jgi:hypothetical protein
VRIARLLAVAAIALAPFAALAQGTVAPLRLPAGSTGPADALTIGGSTLPLVLGAKAPLASPAFTGAVTAPSLSLTGSGLSGAIDTATVGGVAVSTILSSKAPLANPTFSGTVTAPALTVPGAAAVGSLTGNVSGASIAIPGGVSRTQVERAGDSVSIQDYGGRGDWNGTTGTDNGPAWTTALATGKCIYFPPGRYWFAAQPSPVSGKPVCLLGRGRQLSALVVPGAGPDITQTDYLTQVFVSDLGILTLGQEAGAGIKITQPQADGVTSINRPAVLLQNLEIGGVNPAAQGFSFGIDFLNAQSPDVYNVRVRGRQDPSLTTMARFTKMTAGIRATFTGPQIGGAPKTEKFDANAAQYCILVTGNAEGGDYQRSYCEAVVEGIANLMNTTRPGFVVRGGHINATRFGVHLQNTPNFFIDGVQFYKFDYANVASDNAQSLPRGIVDAGETVDVFVDTSFDGVIGPNVMNAGGIAASPDTSGARTLVRILDSYGITVERQRGMYVTRGVVIGGSSTGIVTAKPDIIAGTEYVSATRPYREYQNATTSLTPPNRYVAGGVRLANNSNSSAYPVSGTPNYAVGLPVLQVEVGQRIRVDASLSVTTGSTAGGYTSYITQAGGTAAGAWISSANAVSQVSGQIAANANWATSWSAEYVVTTAGTLQVGLAIAGPSGASVAVGNAQISASAF